MTAPRPPGEKIVEADALIRRFSPPRDVRLVFTNGCFDLLHRGHVTYLDQARRLGELLVVAVNSDRSVRALKGAGRPLTPEDDRLRVLASLEAVDFVTLFHEDSPRNLVAALLPDVLVKGGDYRPEQVVGGTEVTEAGGEVRILPFVSGVSTTGLLDRIRKGRDA